MRRHPSQDGRKPESTTPISRDDGYQAAHDTYCSTCYEILQAQASKYEERGSPSGERGQVFRDRQKLRRHSGFACASRLEYTS